MYLRNKLFRFFKQTLYMDNVWYVQKQMAGWYSYPHFLQKIEFDRV